MKPFLLIIFYCLFFSSGAKIFAQTTTRPLINTKPKLVIGIVVDQMRNEYIYRYWNRFGNGGFKKLINEGYYFKNAHYNYIPTYTGPGHCSIYTGATPKTHGIIANDWYSRSSGRMLYCVEDSSMKTVGANTKSGRMSPKHQLSSTIGDELKMSTNNQAKIISVALKDRSAILPAGHAADAAYWFDDETGNFVTSTWYQNQLPDWLQKFNAEKKAVKYLETPWTTLYLIGTYTNSIKDDNRYEATPNKKERPTFNYEYKNYVESYQIAIIKATPYGNSITREMAMACIKNEQLGKDEITDMFCLSFSSPDIIGHSYGPRSIEIEDVYLRLDKDIEALLNFLDLEVGKNNYTIFLTADHGGGDVPNHLKDNKVPAGYMKENKLKKEIKSYFLKTYQDTLLMANISNEQVFLNEQRLSELKLERNKVEMELCQFLIKQNGIAEAYPSRVLMNEAFTGNDYRVLLQNGFNHQLSGNVAFIYQPAYMDHGEKGTTHGSGYNYDTHVPIIFYGKGIKKGDNYKYTTITQIAPTVCELMQINQSNSCIAEPLNDYFNNH
jgi:predicted AlkP superfamily pyrophosphatase or phosphodiesterase